MPRREVSFQGHNSNKGAMGRFVSLLFVSRPPPRVAFFKNRRRCALLLVFFGGEEGVAGVLNLDEVYDRKVNNGVLQTSLKKVRFMLPSGASHLFLSQEKDKDLV